MDSDFINPQKHPQYNSSIINQDNSILNNIHPLNPELKISKWSPDVIVLGPGGMKGFLELGALIPFEKLGILDKTKVMIGVSVGSIILLMYLLGYSIEDIIQEGLNVKVEQDFADFNLENLKAKGIFSMNKLAEKLSNIVLRKFGYIPTLKQLHNYTGIHFLIVTSKLPGSEIHLDHISDPDLSCVNAVLFSSTIPFVFAPSEYKGMILYDGALTNPYPTNIFDNGEYNILGMYITADEHVEEGFFWLINTIVRIPMKQLRIVNQNNASEKVRHIELTSPTMDFTGVSSDDDEKNSMIKHGFLTAVDFLNKEGYDTSSLDVNFYIEIPFAKKEAAQKEKIMEPEILDPNRYISVDVSPYLYDHYSSDQVGYFEPIPKIDFSLIDPKIDDELNDDNSSNNDNNDNNGNNGNNNKQSSQNLQASSPKVNLDEKIADLISMIQKYVDKK